MIVVRTYMRLRQIKRLRENYPVRKTIELTLARGTDNTRYTAKGFWRAVYTATSQDPKARKEGLGQVDFKYIVSVDAPRGTPRLRVLISADEDKIDIIKRSLKNIYEDISILEVEDDPLRAAADSFIEQDEIEPEYQESSDSTPQPEPAPEPAPEPGRVEG